MVVFSKPIITIPKKNKKKNKNKQNKQKSSRREVAPVVVKGSKKEDNFIKSTFSALKKNGPSMLGTISDMFYPGSGSIVRNVSQGAMNAFSKLTGWGDYNISENSLIADPTESKPVPVFGHGGIRIKDQEFVCTLQTPANGNFTQIGSYSLNPSNSKLFPKLSTIAQQYQQFCFHGIIFRLESLCSESVTSSTSLMSIPSLLCMTSYDMNQQKPATERELLNSYCSNGSRINKDFLHPVECDPSTRLAEVLYMKKSAIPGQSSDLNLSNLGTFFIYATGGQQTTAFDSYRLYVEYDVELIKVRPVSGPTLSTLIDGTAPSTGNPFGLSFTQDINSLDFDTPVSNLIYTVAGNTITFDRSFAGNVLITLYAYYSIATTDTLTITPTSNASSFLYYQNGTQSGYNTNGSSVSLFSHTCAFTIGTGGIITFSDLPSANWLMTQLMIETIA